MAWRGGIPQNPALQTKRDIELAKIGDDLIHEALGSPTWGDGRKRKMGFGEKALFISDCRYQSRTVTFGDWNSTEPIAPPPAIFGLTLAEILSAVSAAALTDREVSVVVRCNEGLPLSAVARDMDLPIEAVSAAYDRSVAALGRTAFASPLFGLRDAYREDLNRTRHSRLSHTRPRTRSTR